MLRPGFPRLSHPEVAHAIPSVGFMAQVYRRVRLLVSPTIVGVQLTDQQRTAQAPMTVRKALRETDVLLRNARGEEAGLLSEVRDFLYSRAEEIAAGG